MLIKTKNQMTLIANHVEDSPEEFEHESEHSCHDPSHVMSISSPKFLVISRAPEIVSNSTIMYWQTLLFILNVTLITQAEVA